MLQGQTKGPCFPFLAPKKGVKESTFFSPLLIHIHAPTHTHTHTHIHALSHIHRNPHLIIISFFSIPNYCITCVFQQHSWPRSFVVILYIHQLKHVISAIEYGDAIIIGAREWPILMIQHGITRRWRQQRKNVTMEWKRIICCFPLV